MDLIKSYEYNQNTELRSKSKIILKDVDHDLVAFNKERESNSFFKRLF